jgi:hypothetical protein
MNGWTDRETEEMVAYHGGVRFLCGLEQSSETIDHTNIESFRNQLGAEGVKEINKIVLKVALENKFTKASLCSSDTTVQESPIAYPTEVGHLKNISEKLFGIGKRIRKGLKSKLKEISKKVQNVYTKIRLFTRGKKPKVIERKKKLMRKLHSLVRSQYYAVNKEVENLSMLPRQKYQRFLQQYHEMLLQIWKWMRTGFHPKGKIISLWLPQARAIQRGKAGKVTEFGRRWIITRLFRGYISGKECAIGAGADTAIVPDVLDDFIQTMGKVPGQFIYDRGGDSHYNHDCLKEKKIVDAIFRKGRTSLKDLSKRQRVKAKRERALSEATIATIKASRYGFNKPRARSWESCTLKGQLAILGANLNHLTRDFAMAAQ